MALLTDKCERPHHRYSVFPNIKGGFQAYGYNGSYELGQILTNGMFKIVVSNKNATLMNGTSAGTNDYFLDASSVNSLYSDDQTGVNVNAVRGLNLIRAF